MAVCQISLVGNVGRDPEMKYAGTGGRQVTTFSVAVNNGTKQPDGTWTDETDWYRVTVWGEQGERVAEQIRKGMRVFVSGRFRTGSWTKDGVTKTTLEITATNVLSLEKPGELDGLAR